VSLGAEQAGVSSAPSGKAAAEETSFAKSFDEGVLAVGEAAMTSDKRSNVSPDSKKEVPVAISDDLVGRPYNAKAKAIAAPAVTPGLEDAKNVVVAKSASVGSSVGPTPMGSGALPVRPRFTTVLTEAGEIGDFDARKSVRVVTTGLGSAQMKAVADPVSTVRSAISSGEADLAVGDVSAAQNDLPAAKVADVASMPQMSTAQPTEAVALNHGDEDVPKQEVKGAGAVKPDAAAPMKKAAKGQEPSTEIKIGQKVATVTESVTVIVTNAPTVTGTQADVVAASVGVIAPISAPQNGTSKASAKSSSTLAPPVMKRSAGAVSVTNDKDGKTNVRPETTAADGAKAAVSAAGDAGTSSKDGSEFAKVVALATSPASDSEGKIQTSNAGSIHVAAVGISGMVDGVAPAHVTANMTVAKLQGGEAGGHSAVLQAASGELDGAGVMAASSMGGAHRTLLATPTALEIGISNGTHGWLKVRAEMTGGGVVNASLSASTASGQGMLHRELPSLTAYLQQEQVAVNAVVVHAPVAGTESHGLAGGIGGDPSGEAHQRGGQTGEGQQDAVNMGLNHTDETAYEGSNEVGADGLLLPVTYAGGGSWLSVRA
jgi:hypothetical protein